MRPGDEFYSSPEWRAFRADYIRLNPYCRVCDEDTAEVDHIVPIKAGGAKWSEENLQPLCKSCHSRKTRSEATGRPIRPRVAADIEGMPVDGRHWWNQ